jgi:hypothetical protein
MEGRAVLRAVANAVAHVSIFKTQLHMSELASLRKATHSDTYLAHTHIHTYKGQHRACAPFGSCSTTTVACILSCAYTYCVTAATTLPIPTNSLQFKVGRGKRLLRWQHH